MYIGKEKILYDNVINFRKFIKEQIDERKLELKNANYK
jgi:hypothetical protein